MMANQPSTESLASYVQSLEPLFNFDSDRKTLYLAAGRLRSLDAEVAHLRRLLPLAAEHVPDDCPHHDEITEATR